VDFLLTSGIAVKPNLGPNDVNRSTFPLPTLGARLLNIAIELHSGIGFTVLRGLCPTRYSPLDNVLIYLGVTSYIAEIRGCQDSSGNMLSKSSCLKNYPVTSSSANRASIVHVKDLGDQIPHSQMRQSPYSTNAQVSFLFHRDDTCISHCSSRSTMMSVTF
jgi:hypothetical protein